MRRYEQDDNKRRIQKFSLRWAGIHLQDDLI